MTTRTSGARLDEEARQLRGLVGAIPPVIRAECPPGQYPVIAISA